MSTTLIVVEGLDGLKFVPEFTPTVELAMTRALNTTATKSRTKMDRTIRSQVAFPASYLRPSNKRLWVKSKAKSGKLEATIEGRGEPTSLARFTRQKPLAKGKRHRGGKINVTVKPGRKKTISRAFLIRLKNNNIGLAMRTDGTTPRRAYKPKLIGKNLWLLYGPSVDQALVSATSGGGVVEQMTPDMLDILESEFSRQYDLLEKQHG